MSFKFKYRPGKYEILDHHMGGYLDLKSKLLRAFKNKPINHITLQSMSDFSRKFFREKKYDQGFSEPFFEKEFQRYMAGFTYKTNPVLKTQITIDSIIIEGINKKDFFEILKRNNKNFIEKKERQRKERELRDQCYEKGKKVFKEDLGKLKPETLYYLYETTYEQNTSGLKFIEALEKYYPNSKEYDLVK